MSQLGKLILKILLIIFFNYKSVYAENQNELSIGIAVGNGVMENVSGMHNPVTGNLGTNIKSLVLDDDRPLKIINAPQNISAAIMRLQEFDNRFLYVVKYLDKDISKYLSESQEAS